MRDGQQLGYRTILVEDASRGIDQGRVAATVQGIRENHGLVVSSKEVGVCVNTFKYRTNVIPIQVNLLVKGVDRRPELGYKLALECRKIIKYYPQKNKNSKYNV